MILSLCVRLRVEIEIEIEKRWKIFSTHLLSTVQNDPGEIGSPQTVSQVETCTTPRQAGSELKPLSIEYISRKRDAISYVTF